MNTSRSIVRDLYVAIAGALAALAWRELFAMWSRGPALRIYEQLVRHFNIDNDALLVMATDLLFALICGLLFGELFVRIERPDRYRTEAIAVLVFLAAVFSAAAYGGEGAGFLLHLPPLWLSLLVFAVRVGYGIKAERKRVDASGRE